MGDTWHLDEVFAKIQGRPQYLWQAVDGDGDRLDILCRIGTQALGSGVKWLVFALQV